MSNLPIALQLYSVRSESAENLPALLRRLVRMGYDGVEFAGYHGHSASDLRAMLDDNALKCAGAHLSLDTLTGAEFDRTVEFNKTLGNARLIVPWLPEQFRDSPSAWEKTAALFNDLAEKVNAAQMRVGYHNHSVEFEKLPDGRYPLDVFLTATSRDVIMQFDTGNALHGGVDISGFIERYPGRAATVHLKEWTDAPEGAVIGEGAVPWERVFRLCETVGGTKWYIVEQELYPVPPLVAAEKCIRNLRAMGK